MLKLELLLLMLAAAALPAVFQMPQGWEEPLLSLRLESPSFSIAPGDSGFRLPDTIKESSLSFDTVHNTIKLRTRQLDYAVIRLGKAALYSLDLDLVKTRGSADLSGLPLKKLFVKLRGGESRISVGRKPPALPDSVGLRVMHGKLRFDHFGALNAAAFKVDIRGGRAVMDFRGLEKDIEGAVVLMGGSTTLVFPENANVTITRGTSAMSCIFGRDFEAHGNQIIRNGSGPSCHIALEAWAGSLTLLTAGEEMSLDEALEGKKQTDWIKQIYLDDLDDYVRYNRVEGLYLGTVFDSRRLKQRDIGLTAKAGYAISQKLVEYEVGVVLSKRTRGLGLDVALTNGKKVDSWDDWIISTGESTLQMLLFGNDYKNYFFSKYIELKGSLKAGRSLTFFGKAGRDFYRSVPVRQKFYLFGSDTLGIQDNFGLQERKDIFLQAGVAFNNAGDVFPRKGIHAWINGEYSGGAIKSEFAYRKAVADLRAYCPATANCEMSFRTYLGEITGKEGNDNVVYRKFFDLGGPGTVRGLKFRDDWSLMQKDRIFFLSSEVKYGGHLSQGLYFPMVSSLINKALFIFFFDAGTVWNTEDYGNDNHVFNNMVPEIKLNKLYKTFGLGLSDKNENIRIDFMRLFRNDREKDARIEDRVNLRFARAF